MNTHLSHKPQDSLELQFASELALEIGSLPTGAEFSVLPSSQICASMELFLPKLLRINHAEWERESLDGIFVSRAVKTEELAAEFLGTSILISDQTVTPFMVNLRLTPSTKSFETVQIRLGEPGGGRLGISGPPCNSIDADLLLSMLRTRIDKVDWIYVFDLVAPKAERVPN